MTDGISRKRPLSELPLLDLIRRAQGSRGGSEQMADGQLDVDAGFRSALSLAIAESDLSRWQIAARMGQLLNADVSTSQLNAWTAPSHSGHRFPASYLPAFCCAVQSTSTLELLADHSGVTVLASEEVLLARRARTDRRIQRLREERRSLDRALTSLEAASNE